MRCSPSKTRSPEISLSDTTGFTLSNSSRLNIRCCMLLKPCVLGSKLGYIVPCSFGIGMSFERSCWAASGKPDVFVALGLVVKIGGVKYQDMVNRYVRPTEVEDRLMLGRWEGNLIK